MAKILVIDDNISMRETLKCCLELNDFAVITAHSGKDGIEKAESQNPDLILLDILMPDMDGYTFVKKLQAVEETKDIPIIVVSGNDDPGYLAKIEGITDYLVKPFDPEQLIRLIKKSIDR